MIATITGLVLILLGMLFRMYSIHSLGKMFSAQVAIREGHHLKKDGIYAILRHPSYTGMLISFIGFGLSLNNWISLLIIIVLVGAVMIYRIKVEENALMTQFPEEYAAYKKKTYRLIPWVY